MMKMMFCLFSMFFMLMINKLEMLIFLIFISLMLLSFILLINMNYNDYWMNMYSWMGMDNYSMILMYLSLWIIMLMMMVSFKVKNKKYFVFILMMLMISLMMSFSMMNYLMFYLFFEISLIPTFMLIMGWGYQSERLNAGMFMFLYTMFASLPLLVLIYYLYNYYDSLNYMIMFLYNLNLLNLNIFVIYFYLFFAFLVKLPMFMFHMWLPKAHVEAPVTGSMILAGVMLKLGGYGIIRSMMIMLNYCVKFNNIFFVMSLFGMLMLSLVCLRQLDMKVLVAYSSVVHMAMMLMGLLTLSYWGLWGGMMMMIGHGLCSSAMFVLVNYLYERSKSRNLMINKGMIYMLPSFSLFFFMFCVANMSAPPTLNLLSELMIINVLLNWSMNILLVLILSMYLSATYSLYLFSYCIHGKFNNFLMKIYINNVNNFLLLLIHLIPLNLLILKMDLIF
uniref:NADH-ubiquinone oxidoreductase chain 4 n=1 Tax=Megaphragma amalphitanum TaxID=1735703 RepID=A0A0P0CHQ6_9HYME|nr:NADH dehydrogenase subunit 4 [Megaphragma amalphitanum]ALI86569.1 NADH dehydrogenase subunit 4 [Megaphragma amalphitanum]